MIAEYLNFDIVLLNEDLEMVDELYSKTKKKLVVNKKNFIFNRHYVYWS